MSTAGMLDIACTHIDPFAADFLADPYAYHPTLRDIGSVFWLERYGIYGSARHAPVVAALSDHGTFCSGRGVGLSDFSKEPPWRPPSLLLEADPPLHDRTRAVMNKVASLAALKAHLPAWRTTSDTLVATLVARRRFDAVTDLAEILPLRIFPDMIGLPPTGREHLLVYAAATFNAFGPHNTIFSESNARAAQATAWVSEACRRENLSDDGWGMQVYRQADAGACTEAEAQRLVRSFLSAGVDTTVNGIGNMLRAFAAFPDQYTVLRSDPKTYRKRAFEESLRWDSTVQTFFRTTRRATELERHAIPEGSKILLFLAAANRDPRRWADADVFDITRATSGHVGFGFGIHQCLGQMVARMEAEVLLEALVPRVRAIRAIGPEVRRLNNTLHALASLPVEIDPA